jgi:alpha-L-rhamnosidase
MKGNSLDIPTDCPTRERAGWTGDAQIFAATGSFLMNTAPFLGKWLQDLAADQRSNGMVPNMVPDAGRYRSSIVSEMTEGSAGWGDAAILIPWTLYVTFEDTRILKRQYESMRNWIRYALTQSKKGNVSEKLGHLRNLDAGRLHRQPFIWNNGYHWEEWLAPGERERTSWNITRNVFTNRKSETMVATAYLAHSVGLFATIAGILGREADQVRYTDLYEQMRRAFAEEFLTDGKLDPDEQASYVRALTFDLIPAPFRAAAVDRLAELIVAEGNHLRTGFLSTPFICHVLSGNGLADLAYELLRQDTSPSWLYAIDKGATTIWESWDAIDADGTIHGSLNHVAFGSIGSWLHEVVAGIVPDTDDPGYRHFYLRPIPGGNLTFARATYKSTHGTIASSWSIDGDIMKYDFTVPPNTTATVTIPHANVSQVSEGDTSITQIHEIHSIREDGDGITFEVAAGTYSLTWNWAHPDTPQ